MIKQLPNFITLLNLFCGILSIISVFEGELWYASIFILIASVFDFMDGFAARLLNAYSEIGKQMDSLADLVSFGLAPAFILHQLMKTSWNYEQLWLPEFSLLTFIVFLPFLVALFSALRLAKFNVDENQTSSFIGLPTPASALFIASLPLIIQFDGGTISWFFEHPHFLIAVSVFIPALLVSRLPLFSLKFKNFSFADNKIRFTFLGICLILLITLHFVSIPFIIVTYVGLSVVENIFVKEK
jgi:CDP-diacylglycerol---serine O-phosphatidyltransferase